MSFIRPSPPFRFLPDWVVFDADTKLAPLLEQFGDLLVWEIEEANEIPEEQAEFWWRDIAEDLDIAMDKEESDFDPTDCGPPQRRRDPDGWWEVYQVEPLIIDNDNNDNNNDNNDNNEEETEETNNNNEVTTQVASQQESNNEVTTNEGESIEVNEATVTEFTEAGEATTDTDTTSSEEDSTEVTTNGFKKRRLVA